MHEPKLSTAYENSPAIFRRIAHALSCTTTHENKTALRYAQPTTSLHSRRGYAGAPCPKQSLTRASLQHHHLLPPRGSTQRRLVLGAAAPQHVCRHRERACTQQG